MSVARFPVDASTCDREPIHALGAIQPFGYLFVLSSDWMITRVSANIEGLLGVTSAAVLGKPLGDLVSNEAIHSIRNRMMFLVGPDNVERLYAQKLLDKSERRFDLAVHLSVGQIIIEAESAQPEQANLAGNLRSMMIRLDNAKGLEGLLREGARQVRGLTGFDRVMIYRFAEDGSGEVVAEAVRSGIGSFLGLHYPASDIPAQARALYLRNLFRIIVDVNARCVPVVPTLDERGAPLDLSLAVTRAVSGIHIEYLKNMGVTASLSISIVVDGKLWGLFACHHYSSRLPGLERRSLSELFGQMFAMKVESRETKLAAEYQDKAQSISDRLLAALAGNPALLEDPDWIGETLNQAIDSDGVGISVNGRVGLVGITPNTAEFTQIITALNGTAAGRIFATDRVADLVPAAASWTSPATGMLSMPISRSPRDYVVLFRQEYLHTVRWAGDPRKPMQADAGSPGSSPHLSPRKSFENWSETVKGRSRPFTRAETGVAEKLRTSLIEVVLRFSEDVHAERQLATDRQTLLIAELNHRVRNILTLIGGLVRRSRKSAGSVDEYIADIDNRITALARAHNQITDQHWGAASLRGLIETEAAAYLAAKSSQVDLNGPTVALRPQAFSTLALVIHELMTNSAKYGALSGTGRVSIRWTLDDSRDLQLHWLESGGPPVQAPSHQGFGSTIIRRSVPYDLGGRADISFAMEGLDARFCIPARFIDETPEIEPLAPAAAASAAEKSLFAARLLDGGNVLLVEDSLIIAIDAEDMLNGLGAGRVSSVATVSDALAEIEAERPVFGMLDFNLGDQTSIPIAERLVELGVPFLFVTGFGEQAALPEALAMVPVLQKPCGADEIGQAIARLLGK